MFLKPTVVQRESHNLVLAHPPIAFAAACRHVHRCGIYSQFQQVAAARARLLPLLPVKPATTSYFDFKLPTRRSGALLRSLEIVKKIPMPIASYRQFRIELADGWSAMIERDSTSVFLRITPSTHTAELRLTTFDPQQMSAKDWVDFAAHTNRMKNRPVLAAEVGPMAGYEVQFVGGSTWIRGWVLECNGTPLDITYRSDVSLRGLDDADITTMLKSLQLETITKTRHDNLYQPPSFDDFP